MSHKYDPEQSLSCPPLPSTPGLGNLDPGDRPGSCLSERRQRCLPLDSHPGRSPRFWLRGLVQQGRLEIVRSSPPQADSPWLLARLPHLDKSWGNHLLWGCLWVTLESAVDTSLGATLLPILAPADASAPGSPRRLVPLAPCPGRPLLLLSQDCPFVAQLEAVQSLAGRASAQWELALMDYGRLQQQSLRPSQALQYFDHLLSLSPFPPSRTPASDRLLQRRQLLQRFAEFSGAKFSGAEFSGAEFSGARGHSLWAAYCAMASWIEQRLGHGLSPTAEAGWTLQTWEAVHQWRLAAQGHALDWMQVLEFEQQSPQPSISPGQLAFGSSRALQHRIQQLAQLPADDQIAPPRSEPSRPQLVTVEP